jgi:hypothetical protein
MDATLTRELLILAIAAIGGVGLGMVTAIQGTETRPVWPVRYYLFLLSYRQPRFLKGYAAKRSTFPFREQFLASSFLWFFILFIAGQFAFGCGRNGC